MPRIDKILSLDISPERFVNACSDLEFQELQLEVERRLTRENRFKQLSIEVEITNQKKKQ